LRESGLCEVFNYGYTLGYAVEYVECYSWWHGVVVSVGLVFAAEFVCFVGCCFFDWYGDYCVVVVVVCYCDFVG